MIIQHKEIGGKGMFYLEQDGNLLAELVYTKPSDDKIIIEHTEVDPSLEGKGVGKLLVETAVDYVRKKGLKVIPLCPFAKLMFDRRADLRDVLL